MTERLNFKSAGAVPPRRLPLPASERTTRVSVSFTEIEMAKLCGTAAALQMTLQEAIKYKLFVECERGRMP